MPEEGRFKEASERRALPTSCELGDSEVVRNSADVSCIYTVP